MLDIVAMTPVGWDMFTVAVAAQLFTSLTVTVYDPAASPLAVDVVCPFDQL